MPEDTRQRVIDAAIDCILENGFYRASSNAIAERAGLSWGVIQYWFGSRESLMLAVLEEGTERLRRLLEARHVAGATMQERVESYFDILAAYYSEPAWLAFFQVLINLSHDPATSRQSVDMMEAMNQSGRPLFARLTEELFAGLPPPDPGLSEYVFHVTRGLAISHLVLTVNPRGADRRWQPNVGAMRALLARSLAMLVEAR